MRSIRQAKQHLKADRNRAKRNQAVIRRAYAGPRGLVWYRVNPDGTVENNK